jgi:hypothetical protein
MRNVNFQIYKWQRATASPSHLRVVWTKRVIANSAFPKNNETRHCQWHAAIHIFEILRFSLLFLIILI